VLIVDAQMSTLPIREYLYPIFKRPTLSKLLGGKTTRQRLQYREEMVQLVTKRHAVEQANAEKPAEEQRKDFFHYLLNAQDPETGNKFLPVDLTGEAALLVGAGSDTSSATIAAFLFNMMHNERVYKKLQQEIHSAFGNVEEIRYAAKLAGLPYLRACIDETLRMSPPVPGILARRVLPGGAEIDGDTYPAGTVVGTGAYALHHNEKIFKKPFSFIPERWIVGSSDKDPSIPITVTQASVDITKDSFWAFSSGPRVCVGKNVAYMELSIALARIVWLFDIRLSGEERSGGGGPGKGEGREREDEYHLFDYFISDRAGPVLQFKRRKADLL
jgi:cytochrome P450